MSIDKHVQTISTLNGLSIVFGAMEFGRYVDEEKAEEMLNFLFSNANLIKSSCNKEDNLNQNFIEIDSALMYQNGVAEKILGQILTKHNFDKLEVKIAGKANPFRQDKHSFEYENIIEQCDTELRNLQVPSLDIFYLHMPDHQVDIDQTLRAVNELYKSGKIIEFGLSNYASWQVVQIYYKCKENGWILPTVYQGMYSAITRGVENELFPALRACNIRFYAYSPLGGGFLTGKHKFNQKQFNEGRFHGNT